MSDPTIHAAGSLPDSAEQQCREALDAIMNPTGDPFEVLRGLFTAGWVAGCGDAARVFAEGPASRAFRLGREVEQRAQQRRQEATDQAAALPDAAYCPGCGAQLPENTGCQNPGCDGIPPAPLSDGAMASLTGVLAAVDVHTSRQGHGWADATLVNVSAAGPSGASWPASVPLRVPPREYATVADWLAAGVSVAVLVRTDCRGDTPQLTVVDIRQPDGDETPPASALVSLADQCDQPAATVVEAHGAEGMEQEHFVCADHITAAVAGIREAGLRPHLTNVVVRPQWDARCGDVAGEPDLYLVRRDIAARERDRVEGCGQPAGDTRPGLCDHCGGPLTFDGRCWVTVVTAAGGER